MKDSGKPSQTIRDAIKAPVFFLPLAFGCLEADQRVGGLSTPSETPEQLSAPRTCYHDLPTAASCFLAGAFKATPVGAANVKPPALVAGPQTLRVTQKTGCSGNRNKDGSSQGHPQHGTSSAGELSLKNLSPNSASNKRTIFKACFCANLTKNPQENLKAAPV